MNFMLKEREGIRMFSDSKIQEAIDDALQHVSEDKPVAVVAHATPMGQRISLAVRLGDKWSIMAAAYRQASRKEHTSYGVAAKVVWTP